MNKNRIDEIVNSARARYDELMSVIKVIPDVTLDNLPDEMLGTFIHMGLYEFKEYRKEIGGRLIFMCLRMPDGKPIFLERFRIYGKDSPTGIERGDDPGYMNGVTETLYLRLPEGSTILDAGCGTGKYLKVFHGKNTTVLAMDMSMELITEAAKSPQLSGVHFFPADCVDLRFLKDREIDYFTGVNILNVLYPDMVNSMIEQVARVSGKGGLFAFTLPARADLWSNYSPDIAGPLKEGLNAKLASDEAIEIASNQTFLGQMRLFSHVRELCRMKGWTCRVFRFLDSSILDFATFNKTADAQHLNYREDSILKLLEFPVRRAADTDAPPEGSYLVCSIGYGLEVYYGSEMLPPAEEVHYFSDDTRFEELTIKQELNASIEKWNLPFEMFS